jgi:hypothetical protein
LVDEEIRTLSHFVQTDDLRYQLQKKLDEEVFRILNIPHNLRILAKEFVETRLPLNQGKKAVRQLTQPATVDRLRAYGEMLKDKLDDAVPNNMHHNITIYASKELIECIVEIHHSPTSFPVDVEWVEKETAEIFAEIRQLTGKWESQWVYVQRGLRVFNGSKIHIYKVPHLIEWTRTQALNDAADIMAEILAATEAV